MSAKSWLYLLLLAACWSPSFFFFAEALEHVSPLFAVTMRLWLIFAAASVMIVCLRYAYVRQFFAALRTKDKKSAPPWKSWIVFFAIFALLSNVYPFLAIATGQLFIDSGMASIFNSATPFFGVFTAYLIARAPIEPRQLVGILIGICGMMVLFGQDLTQMLPGSSVLLGGALVMSAGVGYAISAAMGQAKLQELPPMGATFAMSFLSAVLVVPVFIAGGAWREFPALIAAGGYLWSIFLALGVLSALAYLFFFRLLKSDGTVNVLLVTLIVPVGANVLGVWLRAEPFTLSKLVGMIFISIGLLIVDGRAFRMIVKRVGRAPSPPRL